MKNEMEKEAENSAEKHAAMIGSAFLEVFGSERSRTAVQRLVLAHLQECADDNLNSYRFNEAKDGISLIAAGIHRDGAKTLLRIIHRQISLALKRASQTPGNQTKP